MQSLPIELLCRLAEEADTPRALSTLLRTNRRLRGMIANCWLRWPYQWCFRPDYVSATFRSFRAIEDIMEHVRDDIIIPAMIETISPIELALAPAGLVAQLHSLQRVDQPIWLQSEAEFYGVTLNTALEEANMIWFANRHWRDYQRRQMGDRWSETTTWFEMFSEDRDVSPLVPLSWNPLLVGKRELSTERWLGQIWMQYVISFWACLLANALAMGTTVKRFSLTLADFTSPALREYLNQVRSRDGPGGISPAGHYLSALPELVDHDFYFTARYQLDLESGWLYLYTLVTPIHFDQELKLVEQMARRGLLRGLVIDGSLSVGGPGADFGEDETSGSKVMRLSKLLSGLGLSDLPLILYERERDEFDFEAEYFAHAVAYGELTNIWLNPSLIPKFLWPRDDFVEPPLNWTEEQRAKAWNDESPETFVRTVRRFSIIGLNDVSELSSRLDAEEMATLARDYSFDLLPVEAIPPPPLSFQHQVVSI